MLWVCIVVVSVVIVIVSSLVKIGTVVAEIYLLLLLLLFVVHVVDDVPLTLYVPEDRWVQNFPPLRKLLISKKFHIDICCLFVYFWWSYFR